MSSSWAGEGLILSIKGANQLSAVSNSITVVPNPYTPVQEKEAELADLAQQPLTQRRVEQQSQRYRDLYQLTGDRTYLIGEKELYEEYHAAVPQDRRFPGSLRDRPGSRKGDCVA